MTEADPRIDFRDMTEADLEDGLRLSRGSGWNQTIEDWRVLLSLGPGLFRVAVEDGRIVASGGAVRYGEALAWICMILVDPARRGHGIGTQTFDDVLERTDALVRAGSLRVVGLDATPAGRGLYARQGFGDAGGIVRMRTERKGSGLESCPPTVRPLAAEDLTAVLSFDREVFGADRSAVLRWALAAAPDLAWIGRGTGQTAYCFGRHGDHSDHVGPVVADDSELARDLVSACLPRSRTRPLIVDARAEPSWLATLAGMSFREQRPFTRMYQGDARPAAQPTLEPAVLGPEFG
jgi:GNAT superfamily N-acetyltransferase